MFNEFIAILLRKITEFLQKNPGYFGLKDSEKSASLKSLTIPESFQEYLKQINEKEFIDDIGKISHFCQGSKDLQINKSAFFKALVFFLTSELARKIDYLNGEYYLLAREERQELVDKLVKSETGLAEALKNILLNYTYQQIGNSISGLAKSMGAGKFIVIQTPKEIDPQFKREVRLNLVEKYYLSFPVFQINRKIIGGMRIFEDGKTIDYSWLSRANRFTINI